MGDAALPQFVFNHGPQRNWCQASAPDGEPCPYTTTRFHQIWNSYLCDWHIDEHRLYHRHDPANRWERP
jgi:hypothetical protein